MEKKGVKEIEDILNVLDAGAEQMKVALADGKVSIVEILAMAMAMVVPLKDALEGFSEIMAEVKDIDPEEAGKLAQKVYSIAAKVMDLMKK